MFSHNEEDYISLTDMARSQMQEHIIFRWLSLKNTIEYLGEWEMLYNPNFKSTEFGTIKNMAGSNNFVLSVKTWIEKTGAIFRNDVDINKLDFNYADAILGYVEFGVEKAEVDYGNYLKYLKKISPEEYQSHLVMFEKALRNRDDEDYT